jgi:hypothetical protein
MTKRKMSKRKPIEMNATCWRTAYRAECKLWLVKHPGRKSAEYTKLKNDPNVHRNELGKWRIARANARDRAMRRAWLHDHPGEEPLPEHLCELDHPFPGFKRWAAKARRWLDRYERGVG